MPDQVLIFEHLLDREGQGDGDGKGQPLRNRNNEDGDASDDESEQLRPVNLVVPFLEAALPSVEGIEHAKAEDDHQRDGNPHADSCDEIRHGIELLLQDAATALSFLHLLLHGSLVCARSNGNDQHPALPFLNKGAGEQGWAALNRTMLEDVAAGLLLHHSFTREHLLVDSEIIATKNDAISWKNVSSAQQNNVANNKLLGRDGRLLPVTDDSDVNVILLCVQVTELLLLLVIVHGTNSDNHHHRKQDGHSLKPPVWLLLNEDTDEEREDGSTGEENQGRVLQGLPHQFPERLLRLLFNLILAKEVGPVLDIVGVDTLLLLDLQGSQDPIETTQLLLVLLEHVGLDVRNCSVVERESNKIGKILGLEFEVHG
mmetsp:Transcript_14331/g.48990  ORF Transcript_14331/g.48990 Transcript_14331/m.48990 type:complete len:372 (+) Transcript_14331:2318-3433(+)